MLEILTAENQGLDSLYTRILHRAYDTRDFKTSLTNFQKIMGWILSAQTRLTSHMLVEFSTVSISSKDSFEDESATGSLKGFETVSVILRPLGALLSGTLRTSAAISVYPLHSSFRDYLLNEARSKEFFVGSEKTIHHLSASTCLQIMERGLRFNMANLQSSYLFNKDVEDFENKVKNGVSRTLLYSCCHWWKHLEDSKLQQSSLCSQSMSLLNSMIGEKFCFWIEALALEKKTLYAENGCKFLTEWLQEKVHSSSIVLTVYLY
jgi:hypothetical protein